MGARTRTYNHALSPLPAGDPPAYPSCRRQGCLRLARFVAEYESRRPGGEPVTRVREAICPRCADEFAARHGLAVPAVPVEPSARPAQMALTDLR